MASEEAQFAARADRLADRRAASSGSCPPQPASARGGMTVSPQNRYVLPQFSEKTPYGMKTQDRTPSCSRTASSSWACRSTTRPPTTSWLQLLVLESQDPSRDVMMYINSPGGSMTAMTAIYDTMQYIKPDVQTVCLGQAASAAAILLAAGAKGKRLMLPNARVLIHQPAIDQGFGKATEIEIQAKEMLRMREWLENTLAKHTGQDVEKIRKRHRGRYVPDRPGSQGLRHRGRSARNTVREVHESSQWIPLSSGRGYPRNSAHNGTHSRRRAAWGAW